jgi:hypothetical protein
VGAMGIALLFFIGTLAPWHAHAWSRIAAFNRGELLSLSPRVEGAYRVIESRTSDMQWNEEARREGERLPGFLRRPALGFVAATRMHRGETTVRGEDLQILREAWGSRPEPIDAHPFISSYGPLNFYLANHEHATGGFGRGPLDQPPPLEGGPGLYPPDLISGIPPPQLDFTYPPHLAAVNDGYALGLRWILARPLDFARLAGRKLQRFAAGASLGIGHDGFPLGLSGERHPVDLVVPERDRGTLAWALLLFGTAAWGALGARRRPELVPWILFLASKLAVALLFFGYARQGACVVPVLALLLALAAERLYHLAGPVIGPRSLRRIILGTLLLLALYLAGDLAQGSRGKTVAIDGHRVEGADPFPPGDHATRRIEYGNSTEEKENDD